MSCHWTFVYWRGSEILIKQRPLLFCWLFVSLYLSFVVLCFFFLFCWGFCWWSRWITRAFRAKLGIWNLMELANEKQFGVANDGADLNSCYMQKFKLYETRSVYISFSPFIPLNPPYITLWVYPLPEIDNNPMCNFVSICLLMQAIFVFDCCFLGSISYSFVRTPNLFVNLERLTFKEVFLNWDLDFCNQAGGLMSSCLSALSWILPK